jgi:hypothetical protein
MYRVQSKQDYRICLFQILSNRSKVISFQRYSDNAMLYFALLHNALSQQNKVIVYKPYRSWYIEIVIAS